MVLEGGGLRGLYTAGVLDVLMENNIKIDGIIGVSAGALFGVNYFSNQKGRVIRYNKQYCKDKRYMSFRSLLLTGNYINKNFAFYRMSNELDQFDNLKFINSKKKFYAVATNVEDGTAEYFNIDNPLDQLEQLRASSAIPIISRIVKIDNKGYLDGGIADSIPIDKCISLGYEKRIVIETQPLNYRKKPFKTGKARMIKLRYFRHPKLVNAILNRFTNYNISKEKVIELEKKGEAFAIRPIKQLDINIKSKDPKLYQEIYDKGVTDATNILSSLIEYLEAGEKKSTKKKITKKKVTKKTTSKKTTSKKTKNVEKEEKKVNKKATTKKKSVATKKTATKTATKKSTTKKTRKSTKKEEQ